jgi:GH15 family glucan-1,4-alpha-glucosidase
MSDRQDDYRPISDYAIIGDSHTAALVSTDGSIDWCCWPHLNSPAVFCRLLDVRKGGWFRIGPRAPFRASRTYVGPTNVLATTFRTQGGEARLIDFLPAERRRGTGRGEDIEASHRIMRLVEGLAGDVEFDISFRPTFDYARVPATFTVSHSGAIARGGNQTLVLGSPIPLHATESGAVGGFGSVRAIVYG